MYVDQSLFLDFPYCSLGLLISRDELVWWSNIKCSRHLILWNPPKPYILKWNVDAFFIGKLRPTNIGGVLRDHKSLVTCYFSTPVGIKDSNEVKLLVIIKAFELSSSRDDFFVRKFIFESDFVFMVNWMNKQSIRP